MEDVIFNGSDARKPTAAAEVRLRFSGVLKTVSGPAFPAEPGLDAGERPRARPTATATAHGNGNGNGTTADEAGNGHGPRVADAVGIDEIIQSVAREVEVTRRLYRSGESEYLIDGQVCRLRDVHDLLMDTGLGAKAYAIIEQGKIGMILSTRPTDRRQLIEEAAGVTKYKARRRAAELKLEAAQQNLTRIDDIVFEVEKQRGTLKRQAAKARRYQRLRDELRRWEKVLFARQVPAAGRDDRVGARRGWPTRASARRRRRRASAEVESRPRAAAHRAGRGRGARDRGARGGARARARDQPAAAADRVRPRAGADARARATRASRPSSTALEARREPARAGARRRGATRPPRPTPSATARRRRSPRSPSAYDAAHREIEGLEADVEAARSEVFSALNSATALRHALEHAAAARDRVGETLSQARRRGRRRPRSSRERVAADRAAAADGLRRAHEAIDATRDRAGGARVGAGQRAHRARVARRGRCARASTSSPASRRA